MSAVIQFKKAVKFDARGRVALIGPSGSGKSYTMMKLARLLAGPQGKIAAIDTEHGSLSKYADLFEFDVNDLDRYPPDAFMSALDAAEQGKYDVFCCDSLSHFWMGKDGALEFVDLAAKKYRDQMGGWKDFSPIERAMVDRMISSPCHIIVTMRTKTEYAEEIDPRTGKKKRVKVGLAPVQRGGLEYEFDLVGYMDDENSFITDKTRCPVFSGKVISKPGEKDFQPFAEWLKGAKREAPQPLPVPAPAKAQPEAVPAPEAHADVDPAVQQMYARMATKEGWLQVFSDLRDELITLLGDQQAGNMQYQHILGLNGADNAMAFKRRSSANKCVLALWQKCREIEQAQARIIEIEEEDIPA